jgi:RNA polymerase sigma factor (sigma-70 family)
MVWGTTQFMALERFVESRRDRLNLNRRIDCSGVCCKSLDEWLKKQPVSTEEALSGFNPNQPPALFRSICDCDLRDEQRKLNREKLVTQSADFFDLADTANEEEDLGETTPNPTKAKQLAAIESCLRTTNSITRQSFILSYQENRTASEIAQELGLRNEGNVYNRLARLKQRILNQYSQFKDQEGLA